MRHEQSPDRTPVPEAPSGPDDALTLLQVLEGGEHVSWREAVAIVQQLCLQLKDVPSHAPVLIEPGAIQITSAGHLHLLSSQQGGDPLVIQLGRLLRSMVSTESVPSELRLLISQATFELAIFESVDQFARALDGLSGPPDTTEVKTAFRKAAHHTADRARARSGRIADPSASATPFPAATARAGSSQGQAISGTPVRCVGSAAAGCCGGHRAGRSRNRLRDVEGHQV